METLQWPTGYRAALDGLAHAASAVVSGEGGAAIRDFLRAIDHMVEAEAHSKWRAVSSRPILRPAREPPLLNQIQQTMGQPREPRCDDRRRLLRAHRARRHGRQNNPVKGTLIRHCLRHSQPLAVLRLASRVVHPPVEAGLVKSARCAMALAPRASATRASAVTLAPVARLADRGRLRLGRGPRPLLHRDELRQHPGRRALTRLYDSVFGVLLSASAALRQGVRGLGRGEDCFGQGARGGGSRAGRGRE